MPCYGASWRSPAPGGTLARGQARTRGAGVSGSRDMVSEHRTSVGLARWIRRRWWFGAKTVQSVLFKSFMSRNNGRRREPLSTILAGQPLSAQVAVARGTVYGSAGWIAESSCYRSREMPADRKRPSG